MSNSNISRSVSRSTGGSSPPSPLSSKIQQLASALATKSSREVFSHCLGLSKLKGVPAVADNMIVLSFDTESWVSNHDAITEVGVSTFDSSDMRALESPSLHGENLLKQVYFYHARILENAHFLNLKFCVGDPDSNRFGQTRFLNKLEASSMLKEMFQWPVDPRSLELGYCPVVVMGHALSGDMAMLVRTLGFDAMALGTVVKVIDTQHLAKECAYGAYGGNMIGLRGLVEKCGFAYRDAHTASNDAAMTLIAAVQMVLPSKLKPKGDALQQTINTIEIASQMQKWAWVSDRYCLRCGKYGHVKDNYRGKRCYAKVKCTHCASSQVEKRKQAAGTHLTERCISFAMHGPEVVPGAEDVANTIAGLDLGGN